MKIIPTFHSVIVTDDVKTADQMYIHHDMHRLEVMGDKQCSLSCTAIYPNTNLEEALDFIKRTPHPVGVKIISRKPESIAILAQQVTSIIRGNNQEYLQTIALINRSYENDF